jgi:hypothetical protein
MLADFVSIEPASGLWRDIDMQQLLFGFHLNEPEIKTVVVGGKTVLTK